MKSLKKTILLAFILLSYFSCSTIFFIAVKYSRRSVRNVFKEDMFITADRINDSISEVIKEKFNYMEYLALLNEIRSDDVSDLQKSMMLMPMNSDTSKDLLSVSFINANGDAYLSPEFKINFGFVPVFQQALKEGKTVMAGPAADQQTGELSINIATPVRNFQNTITGVLLARFNSNFLCDVSQRIKIGDTGYAIIIDRATGNTIGSPDKKDVKNQQNLKKQAIESGNKELEANMDLVSSGKTDVAYYTENKIKKIMIYQPVKNTNWSVIIISNDNEFVKYLKTMESILFYLTIVILAASVIISLTVVRTLTPLKKVGNAISEIATGNADLTQRLEIKKGKKEILDIVNGFNKFVEKMQTIVTSLQNSEKKLISADESLQSGTEDTASVITQIIANIESVNSQILNQAGSVDETAGAVNEIASNIESLEKMILNQSAGVEQASAAVEEMVGNINSVNSSVEKMASSFMELEQKADAGIKTQQDVNNRIKQIESESKMLQDANSAIAQIANQTNLLSMNAAIEAAHAGDSGKGFSVVADEIRKLSITSTEQSKKIGEELERIQNSINSVVEASQMATSAFSSVSENIQNTDQLVRQIKNAMEEQQVGSKQITEVLSAMNDSTLEVRNASAEMAIGNKHILSQIQNLQNVTTVIRGSVSEMSIGAEKINQTGAALTEVSSQVTDSIDSIKQEINLFKV
ncbi:MAG: methyl-accepting chemotaxis protein [Treponema sp.]|nr:methyl-accepting chemotaxis protein [Treponema sp.]